MPAPDFRDIEVSPRVEGKINGQHHVSVDNVLEVLEHPEYSVWDDDERGRRLIVVGSAGRRTIAVVLYPTEHPEAWRLATAYPTINTA